MPLTPVEIRHLELKRSVFGGYRRSSIDGLLNEVAESFEDVWRERADLADRIEELEGDVAKHRELEDLLRSTLVSAERAAQEMKEQARRESELIVQEAHAEARKVTRAAEGEKRRLEEEARKVRAMLHSALEAVADWPSQEVAKPTAVESTDTGIRRIVG